MINWFIFDGKNSRDYGIYISGSGTFNAPEMDITTVEIPGRNGDLTISNNGFAILPSNIRRLSENSFVITRRRQSFGF